MDEMQMNKNIETEAVLINYLNSTMNIPGKVKPQKNNKTQNMGMGRLGDPSIVFLHQFRFTLTCNNLDIEPWIKSVDVDYFNSKMKVSMYDVYTGELPTLPNKFESYLYNPDGSNEMCLNHWDGCGNLIYKVEFYSPQIIGHTISLDYNSSEVLVHEFDIKFSGTHTINE